MKELDRIMKRKGLKEEAGGRWASLAPRIIEQAKLEERNNHVQQALDVIPDFKGISIWESLNLRDLRNGGVGYLEGQRSRHECQTLTAKRLKASAKISLVKSHTPFLRSSEFSASLFNIAGFYGDY